MNDIQECVLNFRWNPAAEVIVAPWTNLIYGGYDRETYTWCYTVPINQPVDTEHLEARKAANSPRSQTTCYEMNVIHSNKVV